MIANTVLGGAEAPHLPALIAYVAERWSIQQRRESSLPPPWTDDPILRTYRFCCVQREDDRVTRWIAANWREPHAADPDVWFAMVVARLTNSISTMEELGWPLPWNRDRFVDVLRARRERGEAAFGSAYMITTSSYPGEKVVHLADLVLGPLWHNREIARPRAGDTLTSYHATIGQFFGLSSFMAAQVVADAKYVAPLSDARDWHTFAASGPGSRRGLNRVLGRAVDAHWREDDWRLALGRLREALLPRLAERGLPELHAQDVQNVLCELDKYLRAKNGEGRPKQRFRPHVEEAA